MSGILIGYARVSTSDQDLTIQQESLTRAGCQRIFEEKRSGTKMAGRPELEQCLAYVRSGDTLVVTRIDRLARSIADLQTILKQLIAKGVRLQAVEQPIDTSTAAGKAFLDMLGVFAEFETNLRKERQQEGIAKAKAAGKFTGKKPVFSAKKTIAAARKLRDEHRMHGTQIAKVLGMSRATLYRLTKDAKPPIWGDLPENLVSGFDVQAETDENEVITAAKPATLLGR